MAQEQEAGKLRLQTQLSLRDCRRACCSRRGTQCEREPQPTNSQMTVSGSMAPARARNGEPSDAVPQAIGQRTIRGLNGAAAWIRGVGSMPPLPPPPPLLAVRFSPSSYATR
eukprot:scaffold118933_cov37-Tisochrysis_lutea.AAC.3